MRYQLANTEEGKRESSQEPGSVSGMVPLRKQKLWGGGVVGGIGVGSKGLAYVIVGAAAHQEG